MHFMNEYEVETVMRRFSDAQTPNLVRAVVVLDALVHWTNRNSDGWAYWPQPARSAKALMALIQQKEHDERDDGSVFRDGALVEFTDISDVALRKAFVPIKAFLTRQGVDHAVVGL